MTKASSRLDPKADEISTSARRTRTRTRAPKPPATPGIARIIAIANQKGGVGKSTTAVNLGAALADLGYRVLVVDLDPQGNASTGLGIRHEARETTVYHVIVAEAPIPEAVVRTQVERLDAVPATIDLAGAEIELVSQFSRESRMKRALAPVREHVYDFILLDCPPSLGLLTINALTAAEELIVPIQCEYYALEGLGQLLRNVSLVQQNINPDLRLSGIVMTMFDPRTKLSEQVVAEVQRFFGELVYDVIIPRTVRLSEAPGFGQPITVYDPKSRGAESYRELAREVARRPPPAEPMAVFDELPSVSVPKGLDTPEDGPPRTRAAEETAPLGQEIIAELEPMDSEPQPPPAPVSVVAPSPAAPDEAERETPEQDGVPDGAPSRPSTEPPPRIPADDQELWGTADDAPERRVHPPRSPVPAGHLPDRRVVVIDDEADADVPRTDETSTRTDPSPSEPHRAVADIGARLDDEARPRRRWRLFRRGGE